MCIFKYGKINLCIFYWLLITIAITFYFFFIICFVLLLYFCRLSPKKTKTYTHKRKNKQTRTNNKKKKKQKRKKRIEVEKKVKSGAAALVERISITSVPLMSSPMSLPMSGEPVLLSGVPDAVTVYQRGARIRLVAEVPVELIRSACRRTRYDLNLIPSFLPSVQEVEQVEKREREVQILLSIPSNADQESIQVEFNDALATHAVLGGVSVRQLPTTPSPPPSSFPESAFTAYSKPHRTELEKRMNELKKELHHIKHEMEEGNNTLEFVEKMGLSMLEAGGGNGETFAVGNNTPSPGGQAAVMNDRHQRRTLWDTSFAMWEKKTWEEQLSALEMARRQNGDRQYELTSRQQMVQEELEDVQRELRRLEGGGLRNGSEATPSLGLYVVLTELQWNEGDGREEEGRGGKKTEDDEGEGDNPEGGKDQVSECRRSSPMKVIASYMMYDASWEPVYEVHLHQSSGVHPTSGHPEALNNHDARSAGGVSPSSCTVTIHYSAKVTCGGGSRMRILKGREDGPNSVRLDPSSSLPSPSLVEETFFDYTSVQLTLCTTVPRRVGVEPTLSPWSCGLREPESPEGLKKEKGDTKMTKGAVRGRGTAIPVALGAAPSRPFDMDGGELFLEKSSSPSFQQATANKIGEEGTGGDSRKNHSAVMQFTLPHLVSIQADGEARHFPLVELPPLSASVEYVSVPALDTSVYTRVRCVNESEYLLLPGRAALFLDDGALLCHSFLPRSASGASLCIDFGVDRAIEVERQLVSSLTAAQKHRSTLLFSDSKEHTTRTFLYRSVIRNCKAAGPSATVTIQEKVPKSNEDALKVKVIEPEWWGNAVSLSSSLLTPQQKLNFEAFGRVELKVDVPPNSSREVVFGYMVAYPATQQVYGL